MKYPNFEGNHGEKDETDKKAKKLIIVQEEKRKPP